MLFVKEHQQKGEQVTFISYLFKVQSMQTVKYTNTQYSE